MSDTQTLPALVRSKYPGQYDDISDADLDAKVRAKFPGVYDDIPKPVKSASTASAAPTTDVKSTVAENGLPIAATVAATLPAASREAMRFATSPNVPKIAAAVGKGVGAVTSLPGGISGFGSIAKGAWNGSRAGWFTGKLAQEVALPVAKALDVAAPVIGAASNALNVGTIAQAEADVNRRGEQYFNDPQVQLKMVQRLIEKGASPSDAVKRVTGGVPQLMGPLMGLYMRSKGPK